MKRLVSENEEKTAHIAGTLAGELGANSVVAFYGELGVGKTTFIRHLCEALGVKSDVTSPTFTLMHEYKGRLPVAHFDCYRITSSEEAMMIGMEEKFDQGGITLIEWAERVEDILPSGTKHIRMEHVPGHESRRAITIE